MMADSGLEIGASRIDLAETTDFDLGGLRVRPAHREVRMNDERRELEPRVAQVLVALASARPGVVSRDRLIEQCWDGRIVGDDAINRCIVALRQLARHFSPEPFAIETVAKVGYSLIERPMDAGPAAPAEKKPRVKVAVAALIVLLLLAAGLAFGWSRLGRGEAGPASIAVLPFRNLSGGDSYFAEGIGEEIIGQLAREPQFRVAGRTSSSQFANGADFREIARRLNVDYVLEGSVRTQGGRVRVNADLVRARDGVRLWSDSYDGSLDDIFAIQQRIGGAIAGALSRRLVRAPALSGPLVTKGQAYNLYLTARGLIRTRNRRVGQTAADLLREAIRLEPGFAPAWSSLAEATQLDGALRGHESFIAANAQARGYARRALQLAPDLAEAHRTLGILLGFGSPESQVHLRRAAELDPNSAENMIWLGAAESAVGNFDQELAAYRRATELDPVWFRPVGLDAMSVASMGNRPEAEAIVRRGLPGNEVQQHLMLGRVAWIFGDFSEAARHWSIVARSNSPRWSDTAQRTVNGATFAVGLRTVPFEVVPAPRDRHRLERVWMDAPPTPSVWLARNRDPIAAEVYFDENQVAAKLMLNAGRTRELFDTYASPRGLFGIRAGQPLRVSQLPETPLVALALRQGGRATEADRLLREADAAVRAVYGRSHVPFWFDADAAAIMAVQGRTNEALALLERAIGRGWAHAGSTDLRDINDEPAFGALHGQPRFERLRVRLAAQNARERAETERLHL